MTNQIQRKTLDDMIRITRKYWATHDCDLLQARIHVAERLSTETSEKNSRWLGWSDFVGSLVGGLGVRDGITDREIYAALYALGFEVVGDASAAMGAKSPEESECTG